MDRECVVHLEGIDSWWEAHRHGVLGDEHHKVNDIEDLIQLFQGFLKDRDRIKYLDFHSHGQNAGWWFGDHPTASMLSIDLSRRLRLQGFEKLFSPYAVIKFWSCHLAEFGRGELFLVELADIFLREAGGVIEGSAGDCTPHAVKALWGNPITCEDRQVEAIVVPGAGIKLQNHRYLDADSIGRAIEKLGRFFSDPIRVTGTQGGSEPLSAREFRQVWLHREEIDKSDLRTKLIDAYKWAVAGTPIAGVNAFRPASSFRLLYNAYNMVSQVADELNKMGISVRGW